VSGHRVREWLAAHLAAVLVVGITAGVEGIIMAISYAHEVELASRNGQVAWVADLIPFAVDGMLVVASIALYWAGQRGIIRPLPPLVTAAVGMVATVGANFVSDERAWWLGPAVAGSVGVAAVLVGWVASWMTEMQRRLASGEPLQATGDQCPHAVARTADEAVVTAYLHARDCDGRAPSQRQLAADWGLPRARVAALVGSLNGYRPQETVTDTHGGDQ
jgi:hypothetical protein